MRPTKPFVSLLRGGDLIDQISVLLPDDTEPEEHEYEGFSFVVHHPLFTEGDMWVVTERSTGQTLTNAMQFVTKDRAIKSFEDHIDGKDHDKLHTDMMTALLEVEDAPTMTVDEYLKMYEAEELR